MIRVAHFSDLHYGHKTLAEADRCFGAAIDHAIGAGVEVAVISGDSTDHALDLHAPAALRLLAQVRRLADHCPVLMLQGTFSHEPPGTLGAFRLLGARHAIYVAERIEQVALSTQGQWLPSAGWCFDALPDRTAALFSCIPTVNKATVAAVVGGVAAAAEVGEQLTALLRGFAPMHRSARAGGAPTIGVSHGTVFGSLSEHGVPMAGFDHEFTSGALFDAEAQAFMLGHIHKHQAWTRESAVGRQCIAYPGSIGRFHFGEEGAKGFLLWEVEANSARCHLVQTPARRTVDIVFEGRPDVNALRDAVRAQGLAGASVRVRWTVAEEDQSAVDRAALQAALAEAAEVKLEGRIVPVVRTRAAGISQLRELADKVSRWAEVADVRAEPLIACLASMRSQSPEAIAEGVLQRDGVDQPHVDFAVSTTNRIAERFTASAR
ncbi:metallophosphatase family protein [Sphaerotilus sp.]|uniref:metallophosphoesterase family protein n=1 Tax=Sphaerotilus sp. TaxID=2093942 RepID=UPI002ACDF2B0|nr:metallophosphatase family protein [Sphaerotilus sp.]MDZ7855787.1 metallophosphatase family protein [Sphaerotilus sp.]